MRVTGLKLAPMFFALTLVFGCKQQFGPTSDVDSLDNFATNVADAIRDNQCSAANARLENGSFNAAQYSNALHIKVKTDAEKKQAPSEQGSVVWADVAASDQDGLANELRIALTAVPDYAHELFRANNALIHVTPNAGNLCIEPFKDPTSGNHIEARHADTIESCWVSANGTLGGKKVSTLQLVIKADRRAIQHNLVRGFGYLYAQYYARVVRSMGESDAPLTRLAEDQPGFKEIKPRLRNAFLRNKHQRSDKLFPVDSLDYILGAGAGSAMTTNVAEGRPVTSNVSFLYPGEKEINADQRKIREQRFSDFVFAEAFDSFYCNNHGNFDAISAANASKPGDLLGQNNTRKVFEVLFPDAFDIFEREIHPLLAQASRTLEAIMLGEPEASDPNLTYGTALTATVNQGLMAFICQLIPGMAGCQERASVAAGTASPTQQQWQNLLQTQTQSPGYVNNLLQMQAQSGQGNSNCICAGGNCSCGGVSGSGCSCVGGVCNCSMG